MGNIVYNTVTKHILERNQSKHHEQTYCGIKYDNTGTLTISVQTINEMIRAKSNKGRKH